MPTMFLSRNQHRHSGVLTVNRYLWPAILLAACAWLSNVVWQLPSFQSCIDQQEQTTAENEVADKPSKLVYSPILYARIDTICTWRTIYRNRDAATTIATIFIALFTLTLWISTRNLWREARNAAKLAREEFVASHRPKLILREAYTPTQIIGDEIVVCYTIANVGETAATVINNALSVTLEGHFGDNTSVSRTPRFLPISNGKQDLQIFSPLEAGQSYRHDFVAHIHRSSIEAGDLFFTGHIVYVDERKIVREMGFYWRYDSEALRFFKHGEQSPHGQLNYD